ncbi:MAG TPA: hypothetical protein VGN86_16100 [Pyrinomonadaceae bacterium]|jgi:hypothetical protein|nr:hypothetical protein [Pyrinomonadaceae bacterium]
MNLTTSKFKVGLAIALGIVIMGARLATRWVVHNPASIEKLPSARALAVRQTSNHPDGWTKIEVDKKFSFYLPPDLKEEKALDGNIEYLGPNKSFGDKNLNATYVYLEKWRNEQERRGRISCDLLMKSRAAEPGFLSANVEISNKRAEQITGQFDKSEMVQSSLCFPDAGDGTILVFTTSYEQARAADAEKIVSSIEFP